MQVTPHVRMVPVPEEEPMRPRSTNIYCVGAGAELLTIDSGEAIDKFYWMLRGYLAATERAEISVAAITHHHFDHSGNLIRVHETLGADVAVPANGVDLLKGRLPSTGVRTYTDGQVIDLDGGTRVHVLATPGHSVDSLCYYIEEDGVLFTGDTLLGVGTTVVGDLAAYRTSLQRLLALPNLQVLCPGHGPLVHDARERLQSYVDHRAMREEQVLAILARGKPVSSWEIMREIYGDSIDKRLRRAADGNVRAHLDQLRAAGRVSEHPGTARKPDKTKQKQEREQAREQGKVIKQARKYEEQARQRALAMQENPPTEQWARMPRYALRQD